MKMGNENFNWFKNKMNASVLKAYAGRIEDYMRKRAQIRRAILAIAMSDSNSGADKESIIANLNILEDTIINIGITQGTIERIPGHEELEENKHG